MTLQQVLPLEIPTFSDETDWDSKDVKTELRRAMCDIGFCNWKMNDSDIQTYKNALPKIESFFDKMIGQKVGEHVNIPDLNEYQSKHVNFGYADRSQTLKPLQVKAFIIPFQNPSYMTHKLNPWKNDHDIKNLGNNLISHCEKFFHQSLKYYLNELNNNDKSNNKSKINVISDALKIMGDNPCKHLRFNYYNPRNNHDGEEVHGGTHEHCDYSNVTFLITSCDGLQVYYDDTWWNIPHYDDRFVINFGKAFEITTNGKCKAALHRVPLIKNEKRLSIGMFYNPDLDGNLWKYNDSGELKIVKSFRQWFFGDMFGNPYQQKHHHMTSKL